MLLPTNGCWKPSYIPFPLCLWSNEQANMNKKFDNTWVFTRRFDYSVIHTWAPIKAKLWLEESQYRKRGANTFQKMVAELQLANHGKGM